MNQAKFPWLVKMAWRDSRRNRSRLLLFISSIVLGIAALVAINSFSENLQKDINQEAKTLLGADLNIESELPTSDSLQMLFDSIGGEQSRATNFISMVLFPKNGGTRLAQITALEGNFPFYGKFRTIPEKAAKTFKDEWRAVVDKTLLIQYGIEVGDSIKIGEKTFHIEGALQSIPGRSGIASSIAPVVYIPMKHLAATRLIQPGSRVEYNYYFKFDETTDVEAMTEALEPRFRAANISWTTVEGRKRSIGEAFKNMATFLNLVGFIALLLGCIGVASAVHIYVRDKLATVAILRCLGVSGRQAFLIYLLQILMMGLLGAIMGATLGTGLQILLPKVMIDFLPIQNISADVSWSAIGSGIFTGLGIALLFALLPLLAIRRTSPLRTLRASFENEDAARDPLRWLIYGLIFCFVAGFTYFQTGGERSAFIFPVAIVIAFLLLAAVAKLLMISVRRFFPVGWSYIWRQSIANLYRPNNQTLILVVSIGLGSALIATLFFVQGLLLNQVEFTGRGEQPNMILFDIQPSQREGVTALTKANQLPLIQEVPIVTIRLDQIDGMNSSAVRADSTRKTTDWVFQREYRVTYRDTTIESETIIDGIWHGEQEGATDSIYVSISESIAMDMDAKVGTKLLFNVQGAQIEVQVGSIRKIDWGRIQTNFFVVFPNGVLEKAPQSNVIVSRVGSIEQSAKFQRELVQAFPNVSVIDLTQIIKSVDDILNKVSLVIQFMALFSILTGLLVLISSVILSKYQRIKESVLLRTLGAKGKQILYINALEYFLLGALATLTGIGLSFIGSWLLAKYSFEIPFNPSWTSPAIVLLSITSLTVLIGMLNSREVLDKPPLEVLRKEI
ncbi:MAG: FtsX-like permease family protein [Bacteroidota bacterium]